MVRTLTTISALLFVLLASKGAYAQKAAFGEKGEFIIGADRLLPVVSYSQDWQGNLGFPPPTTTGQSFTRSQGGFSFLWGSAGAWGGYQEPAFFTVPRIGLDYVLTPHLTLGGDLVVFVTTGASYTTTQNRVTGTTVTENGSDQQVIFGLAPRVGYILHLNDLFSLWLRGGLSFYSEGDTASAGTNPGMGVNQFALDLEPELVITPLSHVGISLSPTLDLPLVGQVWHDPNLTANSAVLYFGIDASLLVYF